MTTPLVLAARNLAERAHAGQKRKALGEPYFSHLEAVADLLVRHGHSDEVTVSAAYLHDLLEDQPAFATEMISSMPLDVVETVRALTEPKFDSAGRPRPKSDRFAAYVHGLSSGSEPALRALPISCADKIHNTSSIVKAEAGEEKLLMALKTRPGEHRTQLERLRALYVGRVSPSLLDAFDAAALRLNRLIEAWFPGRAALIAAEAHLGQFDKSGAPYIFHPMHLAMGTRDVEERTVALLHDVVEDSPWTLEALAREGCPEAVLRALDALTRRVAETYDEFITRVSRDRLATRVKLLDLAHNSNLSRLSAPTDADRARVAKYRDAVSRLEGELAARSLYVRLTAESVAEARAHARFEVTRADHVTLVHRADPAQFTPDWVPGGLRVGDTVDVRAVAECADDRVQVFIVEIAGTRVRRIDGGVLHLTVSRTRAARSREANALLNRGGEGPLPSGPLLLRGVIEWVDE